MEAEDGKELHQCPLCESTGRITEIQKNYRNNDYTRGLWYTNIIGDEFVCTEGRESCIGNLGRKFA